jgi:hypothetical protein
MVRCAKDEPAMTRHAWCACEKFRFWYTDKGVDVCWCGHPRAYHSEVVSMCMGDVVIYP